jgi:hypothetical protein
MSSIYVVFQECTEVTKKLNETAADYSEYDWPAGSEMKKCMMKTKNVNSSELN